MTKPFMMVRLAGTQAEMGAQHGRLVADDAAKLFAFYKTMPERALGRPSSRRARTHSRRPCASQCRTS